MASRPRLIGSELDRRVEQACALHDSGRPHDAEAALRWVLTWDPSHLPARARLAEIAIERRDHAAASALAQGILEQEPLFAPAHHILSQALWLAGRIGDGVAPAQEAVRIQPSNPKFRLHLGQILAVLGQGDAAAAEAETLLAQG